MTLVLPVRRPVARPRPTRAAHGTAVVPGHPRGDASLRAVPPAPLAVVLLGLLVVLGGALTGAVLLVVRLLALLPG